MIKLYSGFADPGGLPVRYYLDWRCPTCGSENVRVDPDDKRELHWCDGGPSTEDEIRFWICGDCQHHARGADMQCRKKDLKPLETSGARSGTAAAILAKLKKLQPVLDTAPYSSFAADLLSRLKSYRTPLPVRIDEDGVIEAVDFAYGGSFDLAITFSHPEGDIEIGANLPTRAEAAGLGIEELTRYPCGVLVERVSEALKRDFSNLDECPWVRTNDALTASCFDGSGALVRESPELCQALLAWLGEPDDEACYDDNLYPELSEGLPGYAILQALPAAEVERLRLTTGSVGCGPGGGYVERVIYRGQARELEAALRRWRVPFTMSADT